jgi:antitoxin ParD1/3/4
MATRNVVLTQEQYDLVQRLVESGRFQNASEVMRAGLRLLEEHEAEFADRRARLATSRADGARADAVRRAFERARTEAGEG